MNSKSIEIIPNLVSIKTSFPLIDFLFLLNPDIIHHRSKKQPFHYQIKPTTTQNFQRFQSKLKQKKLILDGDYFIDKNSIYYWRKLVFNYGFFFEYNLKTKTFYFNPAYRLLKVNIGDIFTMGRHLFHIIQIDLLMQGYLVMFSAAFSYNNKTYVALAHGRNGKTSLLCQILSESGEYISENFSVVDFDKNMIYGTHPVFSNKGRASNHQLKAFYDQDHNHFSLKTRQLDGIFFFNRGPSLSFSDTLIYNYFYERNQSFLKNNFALSYIKTQYSFSQLHQNVSKIMKKLLRKKIQYFNVHDVSEITDYLKAT